MNDATLKFATRLRITIPYGDYFPNTLNLSFSVDEDEFCAKDHTPGFCSRLLFYTLEVPTLRASAFQAVARQREAYNWFWVFGRLGAWMIELFRF